MRQIHVCAWLFTMASLAAACGGEQFTTADPDSDTRTTATAGNTFTSGSSAGQSSDDSDDATGGGAKNKGGTSSGRGGASAGTSAGGSGPSGGGGDTSGSAGTSAEDEECVMGSVKLRMVPSPDLPHDFLCDAGCGTGWLTITDSYGAAAFSIFPACGSTSCESCSATPCAAAACLPTPLTEKGSELVWTGQYMTQDTCGMNQACQRATCVPPGHYRAKACAAISAGTSDAGSGSCTPKNTQLCAEAEFEFPSTSTVELVLKQQ